MIDIAPFPEQCYVPRPYSQTLIRSTNPSLSPYYSFLYFQTMKNTTNALPNRNRKVTAGVIRFSVLIAVVIPILGALIYSGCRTTPVTGRRQLMLIPESQEVQMGVEGYKQILSESTLSSREQQAAIVRRVGQRIAAVAGRPDYEWEFNLIQSEQMNAFALPGGKVAIYEGILPVCENEAGLAVVMAHEVAHALARHGGERMSQTTLVGGIQKVIETGTQNQDAKNREMILAVYGAASTYGYALPYSRHHESEADSIGIILMAKAGYDPSEAPKFWQRFAKVSGEKPLEFMSTHPSDERRAANLEGLLPNAQVEYGNAPEKFGIGEELQIADPGSAVNATLR